MTDHDTDAELFAAIDGPRALPDELRSDLVESLRVAARMSDVDGVRPLPVHLHHRLLHWRRPRFAGVPMRMIAAAAAVVVLASGIAVAATRRSDDEGRPVTVAAPTTTSTTTAPVVEAAPETTTTTEAPAPAPTTTTTPRPKPPSKPTPASATLAAAADCDALLDGVKTEALSRTTAYGVDGAYRRDVAMAAPMAATADGTGGGDPDPVATSPTNVQEAGVDEPDSVKTDGRILATTMPGGKLRVFRVTATELTPISELDIEGASSLFLAGDRAIVLGSRFEESSWAELTVVDLADPARPRVLVRHSAEGWLETARLADGVARFVVTSTPRGPITTFPRDNTPEEQQRALDENRRAVEQSTIDDWVPQYVVEDLRGSEPVRSQTRLCACEDAIVPADLVGLNSIAVLTIDPQRPEASGSASTIGSGQTVYASTRNLYVSGRAPFDGHDRTNIHRFSLLDRATATYTGSGSIVGSVLNQFALSEHDGVLRVATTDVGESFITTLDPAPKVFGQIGQVGGLGPGERIQAVRFLGPLAYVVTFRQTDPLYVVDVSDPAKPQVKGELKVNGFSAYLHPLAGDRLLGVGYEGDDQGRITGIAASMFDVADPSAPTRTAHRTYPGGAVQAQWDHHAFLHWPADGLVVLPAASGDFRGALVLRESGRDLTDVGRLTHMNRGAKYGDSIERALVLGDRLVTVGPAGLLVSDRATLADRAWFGFG